MRPMPARCQVPGKVESDLSSTDESKSASASGWRRAAAERAQCRSHQGSLDMRRVGPSSSSFSSSYRFHWQICFIVVWEKEEKTQKLVDSSYYAGLIHFLQKRGICLGGFKSPQATGASHRDHMSGVSLGWQVVEWKPDWAYDWVGFGNKELLPPATATSDSMKIIK